MSYFSKLKTTIAGFDPLNLGVSFVLYFLLAFAALPFFVLFMPNLGSVKSLLESVPFDFSTYFYALSLIGLLAFALGFYFLRFAAIENTVRSRWDYIWQARRTLFVFFAVFTLGIIVKAIRVYNDAFFYLDRSQSFTSHPLYSLVGLFDWFGTIALAIALIAYFHFLKTGDDRFSMWRYIVWPVMLVEMLYGFFMGARGPVLVPLIAYVIIRNYMVKKRPIQAIMAILIMFTVLMPLLNINRSTGVFLNAYVKLNDEEKLLAKKVITEINSESIQASISLLNRERLANLGKYAFDSSILRTDQSRIFLAVLNYVYEFQPGESFKKFAASLGPPRIIWKSKPLIHGDMRDIGYKSRLLASADTTSIGPTILGDWYMNFGFLGIIFGMFFLGGIFRFLSHAFISLENIHLTGLMLFTVTWLHTIPSAVEGWMAPLWAGYIKLLAILFIIHFALRSGEVEENVLS